jgi:hypothetical protein
MREAQRGMTTRARASAGNGRGPVRAWASADAAPVGRKSSGRGGPTPGSCPRSRRPVVARRNADFGNALADQRGAGPSSVPQLCRRAKITVKGAPCGRVYDGAQTAPPLTLIFHGKDPAPIGRTDWRDAGGTVRLKSHVPRWRS